MGPMALGVDAAGPAGWVAVGVDAGGLVHTDVDRSLAELVARADGLAARSGRSLAAVAVDIPIGLVAGPRRAADVAARAFVGARRNSVFWAPHRDALDFTDQASANVHLAALGMPKVSAQAWHLVARIREATDLARIDRRVVEAFPEASFAAMRGGELSHAKRAAAGALERLALLASAAPPIVLPAEPAALGAAGAVALDDLFDAAAVAWSALRVARGEAERLGDPAEVDPVTGHPIAVWV